LFLNNRAGPWVDLLTTFLFLDFATNEPDGLTATNAIATAANNSVPAIAQRTDVRRF
jgi:hypothetical protein